MQAPALLPAGRTARATGVRGHRGRGAGQHGRARCANGRFAHCSARVIARRHPRGCAWSRARSDAQSCRPAARRGLPHCVAAPSLGRAAGAPGMKWGGFQGIRMGYGLRWTAGGVGGGGWGGGIARIEATAERTRGRNAVHCVCVCVCVCGCGFGPLGGHQLSSRAGQGCCPRRGLGPAAADGDLPADGGAGQGARPRPLPPRASTAPPARGRGQVLSGGQTGPWS